MGRSILQEMLKLVLLCGCAVPEQVATPGLLQAGRWSYFGRVIPREGERYRT